MARLDRKPAEHVAVAGVIVQLLAGGLAFGFWRYSGSASMAVLTWQALIGVVVVLASLIYLRQNRLAEDEQEEWNRLQAEREAGGARGRLFEEDELQAQSARNRLRIFQRYLAPIFSLVMALSLAGVVVAFLLLNVIPEAKINPDPMRALISTAALAGLSFVLFLLAMYAAGMSRQSEWRPLRAVASYMMFTVLMSLATVAALVMGFFQFFLPDRIIAFVMLAALALVVIETILNFVLDFYRPRVEGVEARPAYDSRLLGLLSQPGGLFKTVASTLDYQFGFRVSHTWFYRFVEQAIAPLILFDIITLYLLTCFVIVGPEQQGVRERLGTFRDPVVGPGLCVKWPWPFERVYRYPANEVHAFYLGHAPGDYIAGEKALWTIKHYETEYNVMVAAREAVGAQQVPVNLLVATTTVRYKIHDVKQWHYATADSAEVLEAICSREQVKYLASVDLFDVMGVGREKAGEDLRLAMNEAAKDAGLGVTILGVGMEEAHPPVAEGVPQAFHQLVTAVTQKEVDVLQAQTEAISTVSDAERNANSRKLAARGAYADRVELAAAEAKRFEVQSEAFKDSAEVFKAREFMSALEESLQSHGENGVRKLVLGVRRLDREHIRVDLQDPSEVGIGSIGDFAKPIIPED